MKPRISVLMSFYQDQKYISQAVKSILDQTFSDFEFLIVNDGSTDKSEEIIKSFHDKRIKIIRNKKNIGLTRSLNMALNTAKGKYIARMDADDICLPQRFKNQIEFLEKNKQIGLVGSWVEFIDPQGNTTKVQKFPTEDSQIRKVIISYLPFRHPTLIFRKNLFDQLGFYDEIFTYAQDYEMILRASTKFKLANFPQVLLKYRNWPENSISFSKQKQQEIFALKARIKALAKGWFPAWQSVYFIKPAISFLIPSFIKRPIAKKFFLKF